MQYTVVIIYEDKVVGHVPCNLAKSVYQFLSRSASNGFETVTDNHGAGYGLEVYTRRVLPLWTKPVHKKMKILIDDIRANGLI